MRRALIATAGTVVGLVALLDYRSSGSVGSSKLAVTPAAATGKPSASSAPPASSTTSPAAGPTTTAGRATTTPATTAPPTSAPPTSAPPTTSRPTTTVAAPAQYTGQFVQYVYGTIEVRITVSGHRITKIGVPQESAADPRSQFINSQAVPILTSEALKAQSMHFYVVSGATFTSEAFAQSFQSALKKAGM